MCLQRLFTQWVKMDGSSSVIEYNNQFQGQL